MKQTLPEQLRLAADIREKNLPWNVRVSPTAEWEVSFNGGDNHLEFCLYKGYEIRRAPLTFPDPPEGREWRNPENLTPEQVGVPEWRLLLRGESRDPTNQEYFSDEWEPLSSGESKDQLAGLTYRTRAPLPAPAPARVPLTAADVPPGSFVRCNSDPETDWCPVVNVHNKGVMIITDHGEVILVTWMRLFMDSKILRPGQDWQPCSKPSE